MGSLAQGRRRPACSRSRALRAWMQESVRADGAPRGERPGRWVAEAAWPPAGPCADGRSRSRRRRARRASAAAAEVTASVAGHARCGADAGDWLGFGRRSTCRSTSAPRTAARSCFDTPAAARARSRSSASRGAARAALGSGRSALLAVRAVRRRARRRRRLLVTPRRAQPDAPRVRTSIPSRSSPGDAVRGRVELNAIAHAFPRRPPHPVVVSPTYWPWAWPSPEPVELTVRRRGELARAARARRGPRTTRSRRSRSRRSPSRSRCEHRSGGGPASPKLAIDRGSGRATLSIVTHDSVDRLVEADLVVEEHAVDTYSIVEGDPLSAETRADWTIGLSRGDWRTRVVTRA